MILDCITIYVIPVQFYLNERIHNSLLEIMRGTTMTIIDKYVIAKIINSHLPSKGNGSRLNDISDLVISACGDLRKL